MIKKRAFNIPEIPLYYSIPLLFIFLSALLILGSLYNIENRVNIEGQRGSEGQGILLSPGTYTNFVNVSACSVLNQDNTYYTLNQSINFSSGLNCFELTGNNIALDGLNQYVIDGSSNTNNIHRAVYVRGDYSVVTNLTINNVYYGVVIEGSSEQNTIYGNTIRANVYGIHMDSSSNNLFINNLIGSYIFYNLNENITFIKLGVAEIAFVRIGQVGANIPGTNLSNDIQLGYNYAYVNSSKVGLNRPATITFYDLPTDLVNPTMLRNGVLCPANICRNLTDLNAGTVVFNVTSWSNYSISGINQPTGMGSSCRNLNVSNTHLILSNGLTNCFNITGDNVVLDGAFRHIRGSGYGDGIVIRGNNVTVMNMNLTNFSVGIIVEGNDSYIFNNYINGSAGSSNGLKLQGALRSRVIQNQFYNFYTSLDIENSNNSLIEGNYIGFSRAAGIGLSYSANNTLGPNVLNKSSSGISLLYSNNNKIIDSDIIDSDIYGIRIQYSELNELTNLDIINPLGDGLVVESEALGPYSLVNPLKINLLNNVKVINGNNLKYDLDINTPHGTYVRNQLFLEIVDSSFTTYRINNTYLNFVSSENSRINFTDIIYNAKGSNLSRDLRAGFNYVDVNSSKLQWNKSATITFYNIPTNIVNPTILRNGVLCPSTMCRNLTSLNAGTVKFNVTSWTNYTLGGSTPIIPSTLVVNEPANNRVYFTNQFPVSFNVSLSSNGTVKFSLNNGTTNTTMSTNNNRGFIYSQSSLSVGNYTFIAYANFSSGVNLTKLVNFSVVNVPVGQGMSIEEPDEDEEYREGVFPVTFRVSLTLNGTVKFSLNNGNTNTTMNTTNNIDFTYRQVSLGRGSYTFIAYANFSNGTRITDRVNFSVVANTGSSTGSTSSSGSGSTSSSSTSGGPSPNNTNNNPNNRTYASTTASSGGASGPSSASEEESDTLRKVVFWLIVGIMIVIIVILIILVVRSLRARIALQNQPVTPRPTNYPQPTRLMSNLR